MRIAIFSDIHDHIRNLRRALDWIGDADRGIGALVICGDLCSPFILVEIQTYYLKPIHLVFGNNDGDQFRITRNAGRHVIIHGELGELICANGELTVRGQTNAVGFSIAFNHYPHIGDALARSGRYDAVFYGHDHRRMITWFDHEQQLYRDRAAARNTLLVNPGTLMGYDPAGEKGAREIPATFAVLDTEGRTVEIVEL